MLNKSKNILVLGASGMLGSAVLRFIAQKQDYHVYGSVRSSDSFRLFPSNLHSHIVVGPDVGNLDGLVRLFSVVKPHVVINCVGLIKQLAEADDPLAAIPINALFPHRLAQLCLVADARLIHISTDCVFSGSKGMYTESDFPDANDLYGRSKYLGEVDYSNAITLRTSIIGHELAGARSLVGWFLAQTGSVRGFKKAIFSGLPTVEIARIIRDYVIPNPKLHGLYHVSSEPINKFDLLSLIANIYSKKINIEPDEIFKIDRSLDSSRFRQVTNYIPARWPELVSHMHKFR